MNSCMGLSAVDADLPVEALSADTGLADVDLDDVWLDLHVTLTGGVDTNGDPLFDAVLGGCPLGEGPLFLPPDSVRRVSAELGRIAEPELRARHRAHLGHDDYERVADYFVELAVFYQAAAEAGWGVLKYLY